MSFASLLKSLCNGWPSKYRSIISLALVLLSTMTASESGERPITEPAFLIILLILFYYTQWCFPSSRAQQKRRALAKIRWYKKLYCSLQNETFLIAEGLCLVPPLHNACAGLKIGSFTPSCIEGMRFAVLTGRADCHYLCLTSLPSDVSMLAYFNNISCCCRSRCYWDANFQIGWKSLSWGYSEVPRMHVGCLVSNTG